MAANPSWEVLKTRLIGKIGEDDVEELLHGLGCVPPTDGDAETEREPPLPRDVASSLDAFVQVCLLPWRCSH